MDKQCKSFKRLPKKVIGKLIFNRLCLQLKAYADNPDEHLRHYEEKCRKLPLEDVVSLKSYLEDELQDMERNACKIASSSVEGMLAQMLINLYRTYLATLNATTH